MWGRWTLETHQALLREKERERRRRRNPMCWRSHQRRVCSESNRRAYRRRWMRLHPDPPAPAVSEEERCIEWAIAHAGPDSRLASSLSGENELCLRRGR